MTEELIEAIYRKEIAHADEMHRKAVETAERRKAESLRGLGGGEKPTGQTAVLSRAHP